MLQNGLMLLKAVMFTLELNFIHHKAVNPFCKSFSRMGARFTYVQLDAAELFPALRALLL